MFRGTRSKNSHGGKPASVLWVPGEGAVSHTNRLGQRGPAGREVPERFDGGHQVDVAQALFSLSPSLA